MADMNVLVTPPVNETHRAELAKVSGAHYTYCPPEQVTAEMLCDFNIVFGNIAPELIRGAHKLKLVQLFTAGTDGYIGALPDGCELTNTTGAFGLAISEHMLGMMLMLMKRLHQYRDNQLRHEWKDMGGVNSVQDATVLTIGLGDIGGEFARKCKLLGAHTIGVRRTDTRKPDYIDELHLLSDLDLLIPRADIIAMALPGGEATRHTMDQGRISHMKQGAILINVGRGNAIDTSALTEAVQAGRIMCGLDVTDPEPLPDGHPLWACENALITPHISGFFHLEKTLDRMVDIAAYNIAAMINGTPLKNIVDRATGYRKLV